MRVFVTGGSGFIGGHILEGLAAEHALRAMARSEGSAAAVRRWGAEPVGCSLDDVTAEHLAGCDAVVHAAASVEDWGPDEHYERVNVAGTARVLAAAKAAGVRRFVLISTNAVLFDGGPMLDVDESRPIPSRAPFAYARTKAAAERLVLEAAAPGFSTVALRPCFVWGPRDATLLPTLRRVVADGGFAWLDGGRARVSTTHVANLVEAVRLALRTEVGGAFFIADEGELSTRDFFGGLAATAGLALPDRSAPGWLARGAAGVLDWTWKALGRQSPPPLTPMAATVSSRDMTVRTARARQELGWRPVVDRAEGLAALRAAP